MNKKAIVVFVRCRCIRKAATVERTVSSARVAGDALGPRKILAAQLANRGSFCASTLFVLCSGLCRCCSFIFSAMGQILLENVEEVKSLTAAPPRSAAPSSPPSHPKSGGL